MKNLYLDASTYDLVVGTDFNLRFTENLTEYVSQKIENVLSTFKNEWFLDRDIGIPYYDRVLIKNADLNDINNIFLIAITGIAEVQEVIEFSTDYDGSERKYTVSFKVLAVDPAAGEEIVEGEVSV